MSKLDDKPAGNPSPTGTPPIVPDSLAQLQSLIELQKDVSTLLTKTDRAIADIERLDGKVDRLRSKIDRAEGIGIGAVGLVILFAALLWWLIGGQINELRDDLFRVPPENALVDRPASQDR